MDASTLKALLLGGAIGAGLTLALQQPAPEAQPLALQQQQQLPPPAAAAQPASALADARKPSKARSATVPQLISRAETCFASVIATISVSGQKRTYGEFCLRVRQLASGISAGGLGLQPGERAAVLSLNCPEYLESLFGLSWGGAVVVPLNTRLAAAELVDVLTDCQATLLVVDEAFYKAAEELLRGAPLIKHVLVVGCKPAALPGPQYHLYEDFLARHAPSAAPAEVDPDACYGLFYTGGTTGKSKGVMLSHSGLVVNAYGILTYVRYQQGCRYLHAGPMFHLADGASTFGVTLVGGTHVFVPRFSPDGVLRAIQDHKVTHTLLVPTMFQLVLQQPNVKEFDLRSMRYFVYGASPMPEPTLLEAMKTFPGAKFVQGYGMTESSPCLTFLGPEHHYAGSPLLTSVGQVVPHGDLRIVDEKGAEVPRGTVGEIVFRGPNVMLGYWNMPSTSAAALEGGWLHTGDGGKMDANGFVFIVDRIKDMIVSGGENVYSSEVESCVMQVKGVLAAAVIGVPDKVLVEKVAAIVVVAAGNPHNVTEAVITDHCKSKIAGYKCPRTIFIRTDALPVSGAGKVLKSELRKPYWSDKSTIYAKTDGRASSYDAQKGQ